MAAETSDYPPLDEEQRRQWSGLLELYDHWLQAIDAGPDGVALVRAEIADRAAYARWELGRSVMELDRSSS